MNLAHITIRSSVSVLTCLSLLLCPVSLEAKKNTNKGNGNGNTGTTTTTTTSGTTQTGTTGTGYLVLGAPGVGLEYRSVQKTPFSTAAAIGRFYRYTFTGIEVQCDADGVAGSYSYSNHMWDTKQKNNNGHGNNCDGVDSSNTGQRGGGPNGQVDASGEIDDECNHQGDHDGDGIPNAEDPDSPTAHYVNGWWSMKAKVNSIELGDLTFTTSLLNELSPIKRMYFSTPKTFHEQVINLEWLGTGNSNDPDGHFYILGSAIKEPPVPRGELNLSQNYYEDGATPTYQWDVDRE